jgi:hypothetical protein
MRYCGKPVSTCFKLGMSGNPRGRPKDAVRNATPALNAERMQKEYRIA